GDLAAVEGASNEPSQANGVMFEPANPVGPVFLGPQGNLLPGLISTFRARVIGQVVFIARAGDVAHSLGVGNSIRADQGQPITFGAALAPGNFVVVNSPPGTAPDSTSQLTIYDGFVAGDRAVILGGPQANAAIGSNVNVGAGAVIDRSTIGANSTIGPRAYI